MYDWGFRKGVSARTKACHASEAPRKDRNDTRNNKEHWYHREGLFDREDHALQKSMKNKKADADAKMPSGGRPRSSPSASISPHNQSSTTMSCSNVGSDDEMGDSILSFDSFSSCEGARDRIDLVVREVPLGKQGQIFERFWCVVDSFLKDRCSRHQCYNNEPCNSDIGARMKRPTGMTDAMEDLDCLLRLSRFSSTPTSAARSSCNGTTFNIHTFVWDESGSHVSLANNDTLWEQTCWLKKKLQDLVSLHFAEIKEESHLGDSDATLAAMEALSNQLKGLQRISTQRRRQQQQNTHDNGDDNDDDDNATDNRSNTGGGHDEMIDDNGYGSGGDDEDFSGDGGGGGGDGDADNDSYGGGNDDNEHSGHSDFNFDDLANINASGSMGTLTLQDSLLQSTDSSKVDVGIERGPELIGDTAPTQSEAATSVAFSDGSCVVIQTTKENAESGKTNNVNFSGNSNQWDDAATGDDEDQDDYVYCDDEKEDKWDDNEEDNKDSCHLTNGKKEEDDDVHVAFATLTIEERKPNTEPFFGVELTLPDPRLHSAKQGDSPDCSCKPEDTRGKERYRRKSLPASPWPSLKKFVRGKVLRSGSRQTGDDDDSSSVVTATTTTNTITSGTLSTQEPSDLVAIGKEEEEEKLAFGKSFWNANIIPPMSTCRSNFAAVMLREEGKIVVMGGLDNSSNALSSVESIRASRQDEPWPNWTAITPRESFGGAIVTTRVLTTAPSIPTCVTGTSSPLHDKSRHIVIVGGSIASCPAESAPTDSAVVLHLTNQWTDLPPLQVKRYACAVTSLYSSNIVRGGDHHDDDCGGRVYVVGGYEGCVDVRHDSVELLDVSATLQGGKSKTAEWRYLPSKMKQGRACCAAVMVQSSDGSTTEAGISNTVHGNGDGETLLSGVQLVVVGGWTMEDYATDTVESFDFGRCQWHDLPCMTTRRWGCAAAAIGRRIFVVGGADEKGNSLATAEYFDFGTNSWTMLAEKMSVPRSYCAAVMMTENDNDNRDMGSNGDNVCHRLLVMGGTNYATFRKQSSVEVLQIPATNPTMSLLSAPL